MLSELNSNWMRRTDGTKTLSVVNRELLVRLTQAPAVDGSALVYGVFDGTHLQDGTDDERPIRTPPCTNFPIDPSTRSAIRVTRYDVGCEAILQIALTMPPFNCPFALVLDLGIADYGEDSCTSALDSIAWTSQCDAKAYTTR